MQYPLPQKKAQSYQIKKKHKADPNYQRTESQQQQDYRYRIAWDFEFFCKHELQIKTKAGKIVPFVLNTPQKRFAKILLRHWKDGKPMRFIVLKARQWGCSTLVAAFVMWICLQNDNYSALLVMQEAKVIEKMRGIYKRFHGSVKPDYSYPAVVDNGEELRLSNGSGIDYRSAGTPATADQVGRSTTYQFAHMTEMPFWYSPEATMTAVLQCINMGAKRGLVIESSPKGASGLFYDLYNGAVRGENDYTPIFVPWHEIDDCYEEPTPQQRELWHRWRFSGWQDETIRKQLNVVPDIEGRIKRFHLDCGRYLWWSNTLRNNFNGDLIKMRQEFADDDKSCFNDSGSSIFPPDLIDSIRSTARTVEPAYATLTLTPNNKVECDTTFVSPLRVWHMPDPNGQYLLSVDVALGGATSPDFSVIYVFRKLPGRLQMAACHRSQCGIEELPNEVLTLWHWYNKGRVAVEVNNGGIAVIQALRRAGIHTLYRRRQYGKLHGENDSALLDTLGWHTNVSTKPMMIRAAKQMLRLKTVDVHDFQLYAEMCTFVRDYKTNKIGATKGKNDDCVMAFMIACAVYEEEQATEQEAIAVPMVEAKSEFKQVFDSLTGSLKTQPRTPGRSLAADGFYSD